MHPALLLIDMQSDYLGAPGLDPGAGPVCAAAARLLAACRDAAVPIVHVWTTIRADSDRMPHWQASGRRLCIVGSPGHAPPEVLRPRDGELIVHKRFYSAFSTPGLDCRLRELRVDTLILAGVYERGCIRTTAIDAYQCGFEVWIAEDAVADDDPLHAVVTRQYLSERLARYRPVSQIGSAVASTSGGAGGAVKNARTLPACSASATSVSGNELALSSHVAPRDGCEILFRVPVCGRDEIGAAARAAGNARCEWARVSQPRRGEVVLNLAAAIESRADPLARQIALDVGKPRRDARQEVGFALALLRSAVAAAAQETSESGTGWKARRVPLGVVAAVTPWNNPLAIPLGKVAPAILYGNAVIWKPAIPGAGVAVSLLEAMSEAGIPPGLVSLVEGDRETAEKLMQHPGVDAVTLTGSSAAGYAAQVLCARRRVPLQAELGGNNAAVIWADADLPAAARLVALAGFGSAGQRCTANRRVIVDKNCYDRFLVELEGAVLALAWGDPLDEATEVGPVISAASLDRISAIVERARQAGCRVLVPHGASAPPHGLPSGFYYAPTIVCCDDPASEIVMDETFGPVVVVQRADSFEHALELCNRPPHGLVAAIFSTSRELQDRFLAEARAGLLKINTATAGATADAPFGGWKSSGCGPAEHGTADVEFFTRRQTIYGSPPAVS